MMMPLTTISMPPMIIPADSLSPKTSQPINPAHNTQLYLTADMDAALA